MDLDVMVPGLGDDVSKTRLVVDGFGPSGESKNVASTPLGAALTERQSEATITDHGVVAWFESDVLWWRYWIVLWGSGYEMAPTFTLTRADGTPGKPIERAPASETWGFPWVKSQEIQDFDRTVITCGQTANVSVSFRAFTGLEMGSLKLSGAVQRSASTATSQPGCPSPTTSSGGGAPGGQISVRSGYKICYYEVWYDLDGNIVAVNPLGCHLLPRYDA